MIATWAVARLHLGLMRAQVLRLGVAGGLLFGTLLLLWKVVGEIRPFLLGTQMAAMASIVGSLVAAQGLSAEGALAWPALPATLGQRARGVALAASLVWAAVGWVGLGALMGVGLASPALHALLVPAAWGVLLAAPMVGFVAAQRIFLAGVRPEQGESWRAAALALGVLPFVAAAMDLPLDWAILGVAELLWGFGLFVNPWRWLPRGSGARAGSTGALGLPWREGRTAARVTRLLLRQFLCRPASAIPVAAALGLAVLVPGSFLASAAVFVAFSSVAIAGVARPGERPQHPFVWLPVRRDAFLAAHWATGMCASLGFLGLALALLGLLGWPLAAVLGPAAVGLGASSAALGVVIVGDEPRRVRWWFGLASREPLEVALGVGAVVLAALYGLVAAPPVWVAPAVLVIGLGTGLGRAARRWSPPLEAP